MLTQHFPHPPYTVASKSQTRLRKKNCTLNLHKHPISIKIHAPPTRHFLGKSENKGILLKSSCSYKGIEVSDLQPYTLTPPTPIVEDTGIQCPPPLAVLQVGL